MEQDPRDERFENILMEGDDYKTSKIIEGSLKIRKYKDKSFGSGFLYKDIKTNELFIVTKRNSLKTEAIRKTLNAQKLIKHNNPYLLSPIDYFVKEKFLRAEGLITYNFYLVYEKPENNLYIERLLREKIEEDFLSYELTYILYQQVQANTYLQSLNEYHANINPSNITYDKERMLSRLIDNCGSDYPLHSTDELHIQRYRNRNPLYISAFVFDKLIVKKHNYEIDWKKEDVFALGLTLLELGTMESIQDIYDFKNGEYLFGNLKEHIHLFNVRYGRVSPFLIEVVKRMLHRDCRKRPSFVDIWEVFLKNNCTKDFFKMVRYHESFDSIGQRKNAQVFVNKPNDAVLQRNQSNYILNGNYTTQPVNSSIYRSYQLPYFHTNSTRKNTARRDMKKEVITVHTDINGNKTYSSRIMTREYNHQDNNFPSSHNQQMKQTVRNNKNSRPIIIKERVILL